MPVVVVHAPAAVLRVARSLLSFRLVLLVTVASMSACIIPVAPDFQDPAPAPQGVPYLSDFMPMLVLSGEKSGGQFLIDQGTLVDDHVEGVIVKGSGHWLINEAPEQVIPKLVEYLNR